MPRHTTQPPDPSIAALARESRDLIAEYLAEPGVAAATREKRRAHLTEFAAWLAHPDTTHPRGEGACSIDRASSGQLHLFMGYLLDGARFAGRRTRRTSRCRQARARGSWHRCGGSIRT
jgi:hypothetical protein